MLAAFAHIGGQMLLARVWLVPHAGLWALWPVFSATATLFGAACNGRSRRAYNMGPLAANQLETPRNKA